MTLCPSGAARPHNIPQYSVTQLIARWSLGHARGRSVDKDQTIRAILTISFVAWQLYHSTAAALLRRQSCQMIQSRGPIFEGSALLIRLLRLQEPDSVHTMALVNYSSSSEEERDHPAICEMYAGEKQNRSTNRRPARKRKSDAISSDLPPLPAKFHDLYASSTRVSTRDDPSLHGGRERITPHVDGNWPTHIYIECTSMQTGLLGWMHKLG